MSALGQELPPDPKRYAKPEVFLQNLRRGIFHKICAAPLRGRRQANFGPGGGQTRRKKKIARLAPKARDDASCDQHRSVMIKQTTNKQRSGERFNYLLNARRDIVAV
jgi:hypothetical protein